jgi:hypothetical protein
VAVCIALVLLLLTAVCRAAAARGAWELVLRTARLAPADTVIDATCQVGSDLGIASSDGLGVLHTHAAVRAMQGRAGGVLMAASPAAAVLTCTEDRHMLLHRLDVCQCSM